MFGEIGLRGVGHVETSFIADFRRNAGMVSASVMAFFEYVPQDAPFLFGREREIVQDILEAGLQSELREESQDSQTIA